jgi:hypothetical protein
MQSISKTWSDNWELDCSFSAKAGCSEAIQTQGLVLLSSSHPNRACSALAPAQLHV